MLTADLSSRHAFVTGGGTGIGAATVRGLAGQGAKVTVAGIDLASLQSIAAEHPGIHWREMDVTDEAAVTAQMTAAEAEHGPIDILVANAGIGEVAPVAEITLDHWRRVQAVNVEGVMLTMRHVIAGMRDRGWGRIVATASAAGLKGFERLGAYAASKHAVVGLTRCASEEVKGTGVTVNAICPTYVDTPMGQDAIRGVMVRGGLDHAAATQVLADFNPLGRLIDADEVAATIVWLCSPGASAVSGQTITIAGGQI